MVRQYCKSQALYKYLKVTINSRRSPQIYNDFLWLTTCSHSTQYGQPSLAQSFLLPHAKACKQSGRSPLAFKFCQLQRIAPDKLTTLLQYHSKVQGIDSTTQEALTPRFEASPAPPVSASPVHPSVSSPVSRLLLYHSKALKRRIGQSRMTSAEWCLASPEGLC